MEERNEIFEVLGRLSLTYSMADEAVTVLAASLLQCREPETARHVIELLDLARRIDLARWLLDRHSRRETAKQTVTTLQELLAQIKTATLQRNEIVHAHIDWTALGETLKFGLVNPKKGTKVNLDLAATTALSIQMANNALKIHLLTQKLPYELKLGS